MDDSIRSSSDSWPQGKANSESVVLSHPLLEGCCPRAWDGLHACYLLVTSPGEAPALVVTPAAIDLLPTDDLNALDMHAPGVGFPVALQSFAVEQCWSRRLGKGHG